MDLFEKVALFERMATDLADENSVAEVPSNETPALAEELATIAKVRRNTIKVRASLLKSLVKR